MKAKQICANCNMITDNDNNIYCQSYNSIVAVYNPSKDLLILGRDWDYSVTTLKHLHKFLSNHVPKYAQCRKKDLLKLMEIGEVEYSDMLT